MARPEIRASILEEVRYVSADIGRSTMQDMAIGVRDWGFRLEDIRVPVHLGTATAIATSRSPRASSKPGSSRTRHDRCPGEGHALYVDHIREILETLTASPASGNGRRV